MEKKIQTTFSVLFGPDNPLKREGEKKLLFNYRQLLNKFQQIKLIAKECWDCFYNNNNNNNNNNIAITIYMLVLCHHLDKWMATITITITITM